MPGRRQTEPRAGRGLRWVAAAAGLAVAGAAILAMAPANASPSTTNAQLSLSGLATKANILGGEKIGVHPGDTVDIKASPLPTAGLENIPALGLWLTKLVGGLTASTFQVVATFPSDFPGGAQTVAIGGPTTGACKGGKPDVSFTFPTTQTYTFTWTVKQLLPNILGGCKSKTLNLGSTQLNQLQGLGVKVNASNQWTGTIQVADNAVDGGIGVQLPSLSAHPSAPVLGQLPPLSLPGVSVNIPVSVPSIVGSLPLPGNSSTAGGGTTTPAGGKSGYTYTPPGLTVPQQVVPNAGSGGDGGGLGGFGNVLPDNFNGGVISQPTPDGTGTAAIPAADSSPSAKKNTKAVELSSNQLSSAQMPVLLAIIAIIALSLVTATYARLYLLRRGA